MVNNGSLNFKQLCKIVEKTQKLRKFFNSIPYRAWPYIHNGGNFKFILPFFSFAAHQTFLLAHQTFLLHIKPFWLISRTLTTMN